MDHNGKFVKKGYGGACLFVEREVLEFIIAYYLNPA